MRQRADRIETDVAPQLEPEFVADAGLHRSLQAGGGEKLGEPRDILADCAGGLAERKLIAVDVLDDAWRYDFSCGIDDAADRAFGAQLPPLPSAGVDAFER